MLAWLLFLSSSCHVAGTAWLVSIGEFRRHVRARPGRYLVAPVALVGGGLLVVMVVGRGALAWILVAFFAWQLHHYQRQNLGMVALAALSAGVARLRVAERRCIVLAGACGVAGLVARPTIVQLHLSPPLGLAFDGTRVAYVGIVLAGIAELRERPPTQRPKDFCALYIATLLFPVPVFVFTAPYAAVAGMTIAHGLQYLVLLGLLAAGGTRGQRATSVATLAAVALAGGAVLSVMSHLHTAPSPVRLLYGAYLGVTTAHFVADAGIWRLRDPFARNLLRARAPMLLGPSGAGRPVADRSDTDIE